MRITTTLLLSLILTIAHAQYHMSGDFKKWHKITITFDGPDASETANPNPFTDYRLQVNFTNGDKSYIIPGYFAADGEAANTSADSGNKWRVHFTPDEEGVWNFSVSFRTGEDVALTDDANAGEPIAVLDGTSGVFTIGATDKTGRDLRGKGRLQYVGERYLRFAETGEYFLKVGADAPENFLAYEEFDNTPDQGSRRKSWQPHVGDWREGDPTWKSGAGKGIIGAINYLAAEGQNAFSFLTMNIGGDDKNVFPYVSDRPEDRLCLDCSKLDQWEIVLEHADHLGMYLHFKTQETENDQLLDGGALGQERKLYYRELIARFAHHLALNWNIGEENTNTDQERKDFAQYFYDHDPYRHNIVIHTYPGQHDDVYSQLVGNQSRYTGASLQVGWNGVHKRTLQWIDGAQNAGKAWVVANDEQGNAQTGVPHDEYEGSPSQDEVRNAVLWGNLMAGGAGVEYYFGYGLPHSDLTCEDFRSRDIMWDYNRHAHQFFTQYVPFWEMENHNELIGNNNNSNDRFCLAKPGEQYLIYQAGSSSVTLDLKDHPGVFSVAWFDPRNGGSLQNGSVLSVTGPGEVAIGNPPAAPGQDWVALLTNGEIQCPEAGIACNDNDPTTFDDVQDGDCNCEGVPCPPAGTSCDDGNPATIDDVEDGFCECFGSIPGNSTNVWLEAECGTLGGNWTTIVDENASGGAFVIPPDVTALNDPPTDPRDLVVLDFSVAQTGTYRIYARTMTTNDGDDSFWVRANEGTWQKWNKINGLTYGTNYQWEQVGNWVSGDASNPVTFPLQAGSNLLEFGRREPGARLDKIFVSLENGMPEGLGSLAANCNTVTSLNSETDFAEHELPVFPNPTMEKLYVSLTDLEIGNSDIKVQVFNYLGALVESFTLSDFAIGKLELDAGNLATGIYLLHLEIGDRRYSTTFVKAER